MRKPSLPETGSKDGAPRKVAIYVQHLLGTGHLVRMQQLATALQQRGVCTTLIQGGQPQAVDDVAPRYTVIQLPILKTRPGDFTTLLDEHGREADECFRAARAGALVDAVALTGPDILVIETWPFGRRQMAFEIVPLLASLRRLDRVPVVVSSIRDILQRRSQERRRQTLAQLRDHVSFVIVHGDPNFVRLSQSFEEASEIHCPVTYSGYIHTPDTATESIPQPADVQHREIVVSTGGGAAGSLLRRQAIAAALKDHRPWRILAGSQPDPADIEAFQRQLGDARGRVVIEANRADFVSLLKSCAVSVSQYGYNTALDLCTAGCAAVVVPYADGGETEQSTRAGLFAARGMIRTLPADLLTPESLLEAIDTATRPESGRPLPQMNGAERAAEILINEIMS